MKLSKKSILLALAFGCFNPLGQSVAQTTEHIPDVQLTERKADPVGQPGNLPAVEALSAPLNAADHQLMGEKFYANQEYQKAVDAFTKAIQLSPKDSPLFTLRGKAYSAMGDSEQAMKDFALSTDMFDQQRIDDAMTEVKAKPNDSKTHYLLGGAYIESLRYQPAIEEFSRAIKLS